MILSELLANKPLVFALVLICGVIFVNGWTDAPNAITASVSTGALKMRHAVVLAAIFNFLGALVMGMVNTSVLKSIGDITMLIGSTDRSVTVLCSALISIILWAVIAWYFGIPTSESHALISGILGAAAAFGTEITPAALKALGLAALGLVVSLPMGGLGGWIIGKTMYNVSLNSKSKKREVVFKNGQKIGAAAMSFMHGAQDSQKFAGVFVAAMCMADVSEIKESAPVWLVLLCATIISIGTSVGGYRIIKKVGMETVELTFESGLAADIAAASCMLLASFSGIPVSTTHTATSSVIGAGLSGNRHKINFKSVKEMVLAWILTFPCCGVISYAFVKLFLKLFD